MKRAFLWALLGIACAAATVIGMGQAYHAFITPISSWGELHRVSGDGWLEQDATITLRHLATRGNYVEIKFSDWHPAGAPVAQFETWLCGRLVGGFIAVPGAIQRVYLTGVCEPRELSFIVKNPYIPGGNDFRELGAQIEWVRVSSPLRVPLVAPELLLRIWVVLMGLTLLVLALVPKRWSLAALAVPILGYFVLADAAGLQLLRAGSLALVVAAILGGLCLGRWIDESGDKDSVNPYQWLILLLIVVGGAALRIYGLGFGFPNNFHPDEVPKYNAISRMLAHGDLNPRYFLHPSLMLYGAYFFNNMLHWICRPSLPWMETVILAGRIMSVAAGTLSIYLTFLIGRRLLSTRAALIGSTLLALSPLHVTCSRYVKEDALLTLAVLLCTLVLVVSVQNGRRSLLLLAGLLAGVAASVKYSGLLSVMIVVGAPWLRSRSFRPDRNWLGWTMIALALVPIGFVLASPYTLLDYSKFLCDFGYEQRHMQRGHTLSISGWSQYWLYHFARNIVPGMTPLAAFVGVVGLAVLAVRRRMSDLYLVALVLLFYLPAEYVKAKPAPQPERYILPCLPFLSLAAGAVFTGLKGRWPRLLAGVIMIVTIVFAGARSSELASELHSDTRLRAADWMVANLDPGSVVFVDWKPYGPRFWQNEFDVQYLDRARLIPSLDIAALSTPEQRYLVLSSLFYERYFTQPKYDPNGRERIRGLFRHLPIVAQFVPRYGRYGFHNPTITVFSLREDDIAALAQEWREKHEGRRASARNDRFGGFAWSTP